MIVPEESDTLRSEQLESEQLHSCTMAAGRKGCLHHDGWKKKDIKSCMDAASCRCCVGSGFCSTRAFLDAFTVIVVEDLHKQAPICHVHVERALTLPPTVEVLDDGSTPSASDDPNHFLVPVVHLLVFSEGWDQREVAGTQVLSFRPIGATDDAAATLDSIYDGVCQTRALLIPRRRRKQLDCQRTLHTRTTCLPCRDGALRNACAVLQS